MSEPVDLDGIEARAKDPRYSQEFLGSLALRDQPALVAEVRVLRARVDACRAVAEEMKARGWRIEAHRVLAALYDLDPARWFDGPDIPAGPSEANRRKAAEIAARAKDMLERLDAEKRNKPGKGL